MNSKPSWTKGTPESTEKARAFLEGFNTVGRLAKMIDDRDEMIAALRQLADVDPSDQNAYCDAHSAARAALAKVQP
jgi:hypothetical protein